MTVNAAEVKIAEIMRPAVIVDQGLDFRAVIKKMIDEKTNSLVVVNADGKCIGLVTSKTLLKKVVPDYLKKDNIAAHFASEEMFREEVQRVAQTPISDFMITNVTTITKNYTLMQAAVKALSSGYVRIPVIDEEGKPIGIVTRTELKNVIGLFLDLDGCFQK